MKTELMRKTLHTAGFASVVALSAAGLTAHAADQDRAEYGEDIVKQEEAQQALPNDQDQNGPAAGGGQAEGTEYGRSEPYEDESEGESMLEPREQAQTRPLSDYNEAIADPNILNATPASLEGQQVSDVDGQPVGTIEDVVRSSDGDELRIIVSSSDIFGTGEPRAAIPVGMLKVDENQRIVLSEQPSDQHIQEMTAGYDRGQYRPVEQEQAVGFMPGEATERG